MRSVEFMLDVCSLFNDPDERRMLVFNTENKTVELSEIDSPMNGEDTVFTAKQLKKTQGTFTVDEDSHTIRVVLGSRTGDYVAFMPGDQCLLVRGPLDSANLRESWYAEADYDTGSD